MKMILSKLGKPYSGSSLARIAVEVGEEEDIRLLVQTERNYDYEWSETFTRLDWNQTAEDEAPAILWCGL